MREPNTFQALVSLFVILAMLAAFVYAVLFSLNKFGVIG